MPMTFRPARSAENAVPERARRSRPIARALTAAAIGWLAGCSAPPVEPDRFYGFRLYSDTGMITGRPDGLVLSVDGLKASSLLAGRSEIAYRDMATPTQIEFYETHLWQQPPSEMVERALIGCLRRSGAFAAVLRSDVPAGADFVFTGFLTGLEQVLNPDGGAAARVSLEVDVYEPISQNLVFSRSFAVSQPVADASLPQFVEGVETALKIICGAVTESVNATDWPDDPGGY